MIKLQLHKSSCTDTIILARRNMPCNKNDCFIYTWTHTHAVRPVHFPLYRSTPTPVPHAQTKEQKHCGAQDRESIRGLVSLGKHHRTVSHLSWDSRTPHQTKPVAHRPLSFNHQYHWLLTSFISLCALVPILHICRVTYFFLCLVIAPSIHLIKYYWKHSRQMKCTQLVTNTLMAIRGWCYSPYSIISSCQLR